MGRHKVWQYGALSMAAVLGFSTVFSGNVAEHRVVADEGTTDTIVFAEGAGTGSEFTEGSWVFAGLDKDGKDVTKAGAGRAPGIEKDDRYLKDNQKVIRLINGVKAQSDRSTGLEDMTGASYDAYRSGEAFLSKGIQLKKNAEFSAKFTFSMPEAVVNTNQTKGDKDPSGVPFAREVGGDGIAFVMTTNDTHKTQAGSGIGYQGIGESVSIELDSYFNGAYCMMAGGQYAYTNWDFDNQLYFHRNWSYEGQKDYGAANPWLGSVDKMYVNYENKDFAERFDHVAITKDGDVKTHIAKYYMNEVDPTEMADGKYVNLANRYGTYKETSNTKESDSPDCATRFADKGVDNRLFTVWLDYADNKMNVSIANGDYAHAVKPANPQITNTVNLDGFNGKTVYMGFTSAIGSSKANHTIHSFSFSNVCEATYKLNYYLKDKETGEYKLDKSTDVYTGEVGTTAKAESIDSAYKDAYKDAHYALSTAKEQETSVKLEEKGKLYEMNLYYDPAEAYYRLNYYKYDSEKKDYVLEETTKTVTDYVGTKATITDVDKDYAAKYPGYKVNENKKDTFEVTLTEAGVTYDMNVYYDPQKAGYKLNYHKKNPDTGKYEFVESSEVFDGLLNQTYQVTDVNKDYKDKYQKDGYVINETKNETYSVKILEENKTYEMDVYYDPAEAYYLVNYYVFDKDENDYVLQESTPKATSYVGAEAKVSEVDPEYGIKYPGYSVNPEKNKEYSVKLTEAGKTYEMNVYYDPDIAGYKLNYHKLNPNTGKYEYAESTKVFEGQVNETYTVTDADAKYETKYEKDGYTINPDKKETYSVLIAEEDKTYEMNVYYDPVKTTYKTEYYLKNPDGSYTLKDTIKGEETYAGTKVIAPEKSYDKYVHVTTPDSKESAVVEPDGSTTMKVYYDPVKTTYKTEYYLKNPDGSYTLKDTVKGEETYAGTNVTAPEKKYDGYVHVTTPDSKESAVVEPDGSTTMKVYFDPEKTTYKTEYYLKNPDGSYTLKDTIQGEPTDSGTKVTAPEKKYDGYVHVTTPDSKESAVVEPGGKTTMKVYYDPEKTTYKTEYYLKNPDGSYTLKDTIQGEPTDPGTEVTAPEKSYDGYVHVTTPDSKESAVVEPGGKTTMKVYFDPGEKPTYKVEYYVEQPDGSYKLYTEKKDIESDAGVKVNAEIISIPGYTHTTTTNTKESDVVLADSSTVLKVYYNVAVEPTVTPTDDPNKNGNEQGEEDLIQTPEPEEPMEPEETEEPVEEDTEEPAEEEPEEPVDTKKPAAPAPKTNDSNHAGAYLILLLSSIVVFAITFFTKKKEDETE